MAVDQEARDFLNSLLAEFATRPDGGAWGIPVDFSVLVRQDQPPASGSSQFKIEDVPMAENTYLARLSGDIVARTFAQMLSDIGAAASGHTHSLTDLSDVAAKTGSGTTVVLDTDPTIEGGLTIVGNLAVADIFVLDAKGIVIGHTAKIDFGATPEFQILGTNTSDASMGFARFQDNASGPDVRFLKSRAAAIGDNVIVQDGDTLGRFRFQGADGGDFNTTAAEILGQVDGTPGLNDIPGRLIFKTRIDGGALTEKMRLDNLGRLGIGTTPAVSALLDLASTTGAILIPRMTTTQRDALTAVNGMIIYNSTLNKFQSYENGAWVSIIGGGSSLPVDDTTFIAQDPADNTKKIRFDLGASTTGAETTLGVTSSSNRTMFLPDGTGVLMLNLSEDTTPVLGGNLDDGGFDIAGRDVAADGTKLDGIESSANVTDTTNVSAAGALMKTGGTMSGDLDMGSQDITSYKTATSVAMHDNGNSGSSITIDWNNGPLQKVTLTADCTFTFTAPAGPMGCVLQLIQDGTGGWTPTLPSTVKFAGGTTPTWSTAASARDRIGGDYENPNYEFGARLDTS